MTCEICNLIKTATDKVFEDDKVFAVLPSKGVTAGHIIVTTKEHYPIIENIPDELISHVFKIANKLSTITFESLGAQGTNILVNNGLDAGQKFPHMVVHIIPRRENDNLNLSWQPMQANPEELPIIEEKIKAFFNTPAIETIGETPLPPGEQPERLDDSKEGDEENYLMKSLRRIP
jgi:histidine triad (HIT) family protein